MILKTSDDWIADLLPLRLLVAWSAAGRSELRSIKVRGTYKSRVKDPWTYTLQPHDHTNRRDDLGDWGHYNEMIMNMSLNNIHHSYFLLRFVPCLWARLDMSLCHYENLLSHAVHILLRERCTCCRRRLSQTHITHCHLLTVNQFHQRVRFLFHLTITGWLPALT